MEADLEPLRASIPRDDLESLMWPFTDVLGVEELEVTLFNYSWDTLVL